MVTETSIQVHPLDPLSADELVRASSIASERLGSPESLRFLMVAALEPPKGTVDRPRSAELVCIDTSSGLTIEVTVDLDAGAVSSVTERPDAQPPALFDEYERAEVTIRADSGWRSAMAGSRPERRTDQSLVHPPVADRQFRLGVGDSAPHPQRHRLPARRTG